MKLLQIISTSWLQTRANRFKEDGSTLFYHNENEMALRLLDKALQYDPDLIEANYVRGRARYRLGDFVGAIADYTVVLRSEKRHAEIYLNRALAYYSNGDLDDALGDLNMAIFLDSRMASAFNIRGMVDELQGNLNGAIADYQVYLELGGKPHGDPSHVETQIALLRGKIEQPSVS